jgi:hypothetical protein
MQVLEEVSYPEERVDRMYEKDHCLYIMTDGKTLDYDCRNAYFRNQLQQGLTGKYGSYLDAELSDKAVVYGEKWNRYLLIFDMKNQLLFSASDIEPHQIKIQDEVVEVGKIYDMLLGVSEEDVLILLENKPRRPDWFPKVFQDYSTHTRLFQTLFLANYHYGKKSLNGHPIYSKVKDPRHKD